jgi:hypothetical protein
MNTQSFIVGNIYWLENKSNKLENHFGFKLQLIPQECYDNLNICLSCLDSIITIDSLILELDLINKGIKKSLDFPNLDMPHFIQLSGNQIKGTGFIDDINSIKVSTLISILEIFKKEFKSNLSLQLRNKGTQL